MHATPACVATNDQVKCQKGRSLHPRQDPKQGVAFPSRSITLVPTRHHSHWTGASRLLSSAPSAPRVPRRAETRAMPPMPPMPVMPPTPPTLSTSSSPMTPVVDQVDGPMYVHFLPRKEFMDAGTPWIVHSAYGWVASNPLPVHTLRSTPYITHPEL